MNSDRRSWLAAAAAAALLPAPRSARAQAADPALRAAIDAPLRSAANRARDAARHPLETLRFFGLAADQAVIEVAPGGGWYTEILAPFLRDKGRLYAALEPVGPDDPGSEEARQRFRAKLAGHPEAFDRVVIGTLPRGPAFTDIAPPGGADRVLTFRNVHNWIEDGHLDETLRAFFAVLRPGGVLGVEEHRAPAGASLAWIRKNGYVTEALMTERARAAGFVLEAASEINANPRDTKDYPDGVWSLPPTLRGGDAERARFVAIGESDRFMHRYLKPRG